MIILQYLKVLLKVLLAKHQGYGSIKIVGKYYPKTIEKLKKKNYKVTKHEETLLFKSFITVSWEK